MQAIFTTFGIDWRLLLVNALNFGLLLLGLWYFLYTPLMRVLEERRKKVAQGVADAQKAAQELAGIEAARAAKLAQAGKEADTIVSLARTAGAHKEHEIIQSGEAAAQRILDEAEAQAREAKAQAIAESREEVARMVVLGMEKVFKGKSI